MENKDLNKIAKIESAIKNKYGEEAIQNPKKNWNKEKENNFLEQLKQAKNKKTKEKNIEQKEGFVLKSSKKNTPDRNCPVCGSYSFSTDDDIYMTKFNCCFNCYIRYVEGREQRWKSGWRPNN